MKKLVSTVALFVMMLVVSSAKTPEIIYLAEGDKAPDLKLENSESKIDLASCRGEYVLLTFWSSSDAQSRSDCNVYSAWFANEKPTNVKHISVNFDFEKMLFEEIVKLDNLDEKAQYNVQGLVASQILNDYNLLEGFGSVLIDRDGRISKFNPSLQDLSSL